MGNEPVRWTIIGHLHDEAKLLDHFFDDVKHFKEIAAQGTKDEQKQQNKFVNDEQQNNVCIAPSKIKYLDEIKERLQFLQYVLLNNHTIKLTEDHANTLWESFVVNALTLKERELTFGSFKKMVHSGRPLKYIYLQEAVPEILFTNHMMIDIATENMTLPAYDCFERYFVFVNCQKNHLQMLYSNKAFMVNNYDHLIGLDMLWEIALKSKNDIVHKKSTDMINKICNRVSAELKSDIGRIRASVLDKIMTELLSSLNEPTTAKSERVLNLLHHFLNASESRGMGGLRPHEALSRGKKWHLTVIDKIRFNGYGKPPQFKVTVHENDSLWDLRRAVGKKAETYPELVRVYFRGQPLNEDKNSLTLQQLNMRDAVTIHCMKKDQKSERVPLLTGTPPRLVGVAKNALTEVFHQFASNKEDDSMSFDDMKKYVLKCGAGENSASKTRIQTIFTQHGTQPQAYQDRLSLKGFFNFYRSACEDRPDHVWNDLNVFKYRYDLRKEDEARKEEEALLNAKPETLPRFILTTNNKYFDILFKNCLQSKDSKIKQMAWKLILRLPTNPARRQQIMDLNAVTPIDWEQLLPSSNLFSLVYGVLICESLTIEPESIISENELDERCQWRAAFLEQKGFEHLTKILFTFKYNGDKQEAKGDSDQHNTEKVTQQLALTAVLKMIQAYFVGAISCNQSMRDVVDQIQSLSLNTSEEKKEDKTVVKKEKKEDKTQKKRKSYGAAGGGSGELYDIDYAYLIDSDDEDDDDDDDRDATQDFTALLEQQFADAVMEASGMPESMYNETKNEWDQLEGLTGGGQGGEGDFIGPKLPHQMGGGGHGNVVSDEKDGKEEKGPPRHEKNPNYDMGDHDIDIDDIDVDNAELPDEETLNKAVGQGPPPMTHRQSSIKFHQLIKSVEERYADAVIDSLDFAKLMKQLLNILKVASSDQSPTIQRDLVVRYAVRLWVSVLLYRPRLLLDLFDFLRKDPSFILAAIQSTDPELGSEFAKSIRKLCRYVDESPNYKSDTSLQEELPGISIVKFFLEEILLKHLPSSDTQGIDPEQHFYLLISLMQEYSDKYHGSVAEFSELFFYLVDELKRYTSRETFDKFDSDKVLVGLMTLLSVLLAGHVPYREECGKLGIIEELLNNFLFATGKTDQDKKSNLPKCKTHNSRELAYRLVVQCILGVPNNYSIVNTILGALHKTVHTPSAWEYCPEKSVKSDRGFVGLKNLGSTCYMNSLLQQFYMVPHFRHAIIASGASLTSTMSDEEVKDSLLFQLMRMFSFLSLSEKQAFDTINFCHAYKDETGRPVDVRIQQDAQEFFTILADRVETELKGSQYRYLLQDVFTGQVVHQMICQGGCNKTRERKQPMPMISLPIKNRTNMKESLEAFVQSESLDGVSCDHCAKKCQTLKRQVLHTLPNTIFFHLKRFELNFETFRHEKSNQRFEFPTEINLEPYTREGLQRRESENAKEEDEQGQGDAQAPKDDKKDEQKGGGGDDEAPKEKAKEENTDPTKTRPTEYYEYVLAGIVVHTGSAEAGHYYSYIKDRKTGEWNEFNDSLIKSFDLKYLDNDCYGGKKKVKSSANWGGDWEHDQDKIKNAYILVYDRKKYMDPEHEEDKKEEEKKAPPKDKAQATESKQEQDNKEREDADKSMSAIQEKKEEEPRLPAPVNALSLFDANAEELVEGMPKVWDDILDTNMKFMRDRQLFNLQYFQFIYNLICAAPCPPYSEEDLANLKQANVGLDVIKMATFVCFRFLARTADKRLIFNRFVTYLKFLYTSNVAACKWLLIYLSKQRQHVEQYILTTRDQLVMHGFSDLVIHVLRQLKDIEAKELMNTEVVLRKVPLNKVQFHGQPHSNAQQQPQPQAQPSGQFVEEQVTVSTAPSSQFMDLMIDLIEIAPKHWFRFSYFFKVFYEYALLGYPQRNYMIDKQLINVLGDFYLGSNRSPYSDAKKQYHIMGNRMYPPKFDTVVQIICKLLCACHTPQTTKTLRYYLANPEKITDKAQLRKWLALSPTALSYKDPDAPDRDCLHPLSDTDAKLPHCRFLYDKMIGEAHHSKDILDALNSLVVHWSYEDKTYSKEVIRMITEGVDKSGAEQVQTFLAIMHKFVMIDDDVQPHRLKLLHSPAPPDKGVLHFIKCYRQQHQPFSYETIKALTFMMIENEKYAQYMISKRKEWTFWDMWLDTFCHRPTYIHNQNNQRLTQLKIEFYEQKYIPLLAKHGIECQRAPQHIQRNQGGNNMYASGHGGGGHGSNYVHNNMYGGVNYDHQENYFNGQQPGGQAIYGDAYGADAAGAQRQNSRDDDSGGDLYGNPNDDDDPVGINEGGNDAHSGDDDMQMEAADEEDEVVDDRQQQRLADV
eukprot:543215_1